GMPPSGRPASASSIAARTNSFIVPGDLAGSPRPPLATYLYSIAASGGPEEGDGLARLDVERQALDARDIAVALGQCFENGAGQGLGGAARGWREPTLADLVEQRLVADLENARRLCAIPPDLREHLGEDLALGLSRATAGDLPEALGHQRPRRLRVAAAATRNQRVDRRLAVRQNHQASNRVFELAHVTGPRVLHQARHGLGRQPLALAVLRVKLRQEPRGQPRNLLPALPKRRN